ncbi:MAG: beta-N-acetylhexosaminidase [Ottowia sp.]|nr:beta-N-acetylhexosaminidase [Ottowia sp.]
MMTNFGPIILDVEGLILNAQDRRRIAHPLTGGVILFARNFSTRDQLLALTQAIRAVRSDILICIDHEGGRVQRAKSDGFTHLPAMGSLGERWNHDPMGAVQLAMACGYVLAAELRACGVDFSFTPVLDLDYGHSRVIGDRAFHSDARVVSILALALSQGLRLAGMHNCGKHFPGHGYASADSHVALPVDERSLEEILSHDILPYRTLGLSLSAVMPAHIVYPKIDDQPAGFSRYWLQTILREQLHFDGVIFSDDLAMEGASVAGDVVEAAHAALRAGCDMVLICNHPDKADTLLDKLIVPAHFSSTSCRRIAQLFPSSPFSDWTHMLSLPSYIAAKNLLA